MPLLIGCLALFFPRLTIVVVVLASDYIGRAYETVFWPFIGFLFMPVTTLAWAWAMNTNGRVSGIYLAVVIVAVLIDLGLLGSSGRTSYAKVRSRADG